MAMKYSEYVQKHLENISSPNIFKGGLSYTFRKGLSAIPAALGHVVDTLLGLDGIFGDRDSHLSGPFGFVLGLPFWLLGTVLGQILQALINIPSYLAYYTLDIPLSWISTDFHKAMKSGWLAPENTTSGIGRFFGRVFDITGAAFRTYIYPPHKQMEGLFGFIVGFFPEIARFLVHRVTTTFTSCTQFIIDNICHGIRACYSAIGSCLCGTKKKQTRNKLAVDASEDEPLTNLPDIRIEIEEPKVTIIQPAANAELPTMIQQGTNLFRALGITLTDYQQDPTVATKKFRTASLRLHPDKRDKNLTLEASAQADRAWDIAQKANLVLSNPNAISTKKYISAVKRNPTLFGESIADTTVSAMNTKLETAATNTGGHSNQRHHVPEQTSSDTNQFPKRIVIKKRAN